jgi:pyruvate/2-oxoglutarate dehydrogenase complex dihydrolipoamide acyltransferase (E2) component
MRAPVKRSRPPVRPPSPLRRLALGTYRSPRDPSAYAALELRMERALAYVEAMRGAGQRLTVTHLVAKAAADALRRHPEANVMLRWNRPWQRERVGVCVLVVQPEERGRVDLTTATVHDADVLALPEFAAALEERVRRVRQRRDAAIERGKRRSSWVPGLVLHPVLRLLSFVWYTLNLDLGWLGMPRDPFGAVAVTNVGSLGLERAYVAMAAYTRVSFLLAPGAVRDAPVLEGGTFVAGKVMTLTCTFDARLIDVELASRVLHHLGAALEDPEAAWGPPPRTEE